MPFHTLHTCVMSIDVCMHFYFIPIWEEEEDEDGGRRNKPPPFTTWRGALACLCLACLHMPRPALPVPCLVEAGEDFALQCGPTDTPLTPSCHAGFLSVPDYWIGLFCVVACIRGYASFDVWRDMLSLLSLFLFVANDVARAPKVGVA